MSEKIGMTSPRMRGARVRMANKSYPWSMPEKVMNSVPLTAAAVPAIRAAIKARRTLTLEIAGEPVAMVHPIITVTRKQAVQILREIAEADQGDDWAVAQM
jgi:hypothetical protein